MKKTQRLFLCTLTLLTVSGLLFTACGAGSKSSNYAEMNDTAVAASSTAASYAAEAGYADEMAYPAAAEAAEYKYDAMAEEDIFQDDVNTTQIVSIPEGETVTQSANASAEANTKKNRKIVKHSELDLQTKSFEEDLARVIQLVEESGGYIENQSSTGRPIAYNGELYEEQRSASIQARVPAEKLDDVAAQIGEFCNVLRKNEYMDDISDRYFDSQAHLKTLQIQEERLLSILEKAEKLEDVITLESALSNVRYEIESLTATLKRMDSQITYSYLNLSINEVVEYRENKPVPTSFGDEIGNAASRSLYRLANSSKHMLLGIIETGPVFIFNLLIFVIVLLILLSIVRWILRLCKVDNGFTRKISLSKKDKAAKASIPSIDSTEKGSANNNTEETATKDTSNE